MKKLLLSCFLFLFLQPAVASNPYQVFHQGRIDLDVRANYFKSQANFSSDGSQQALLGENYFQNIDLTSTARWELFEDFGFIGGFNTGFAESADLLTTRKNSIVNRIDVGADYLFWTSEMHETFVRFIYSHPLEATDLNTDSVSTTDGASEVQGDLVARFNFGGFYPYVQGGFNYRSEGFSALATYAVGAEFRFSEIGIGASILGRASVTDDQYTNISATRDALNSRVNAGSKKYFTVNPNSTDVEVNLNFAASESILLKFFGGYTLVGSNSAIGYNAGVMLNLNFGSESKLRALKSKSQVNSISRELTPEDFKEDTNDGVDQDYFKPVAPVQKDYINQVEGSQQNSQNSATTEQEKQNDEVKKQLNNLEYTIKLKQKKKKKK